MLLLSNKIYIRQLFLIDTGFSTDSYDDNTLSQSLTSASNRFLDKIVIAHNASFIILRHHI